MHRGIDVSGYQARRGRAGDAIDWDAVAGDGYEFAIIKATEGRDHSGSKRVTGRHYAGVWAQQARAAGLEVGFYHFARPDRGKGDARLEADHFLDYIEPLEYTMRPVLDLEWNKEDLSVDELTAWAFEWIERVSVAHGGVRPLLYLNPNYIKRRVYYTVFRDAGVPLWVAHYRADLDGDPNTRDRDAWSPDDWPHVLHQFGSKGTVAGIDGRVDLNEAPELGPLLLRPRPSLEEQIEELIEEMRAKMMRVARAVC